MEFISTGQINIVVSIIALVLIIALSVGMTALCLYLSIRLIRRQIKLYNSIILVELKSAKLHYFIFIALVSLFIIFAFLSISDSSSFEYASLLEIYGLDAIKGRVLMAFLIILLISIDLLFIVLLMSKSAVVDRGIYTALNFLDWHSVHDYIIDEKKGVVLLTSEKETFATLKGTTAPLKVSKNDIPKLKFILNKNKNKFSGLTKEA